MTDALTAATTAYDARALRGTADQIAAAAEALGVIRTGLLNASLPADRRVSPARSTPNTRSALR